MLETDVLRRDLFLVNAALTGMVPTKADTPHVPITVEEVAADAAAVVAAGAAIVHLHPRGGDGEPTCDLDAWRRLIAAVREASPEVIICVTCSGRTESDLGKRSAVLSLTGDLRPDLASLTCGSMNFPHQVSANAPQDIVELAQRMEAAGVKPEVEAFEPGMIYYARHLVAKGYLRPPLQVNILLGNLGTSPGTGLDLAHMVNSLPDGSVWSAAGIGRFQLSVNAMALAMGGGVRVGLEDSLYYDWPKKTLATNRMLVERVVRVGRELGRRPATPPETRLMLGLGA